MADKKSSVRDDIEKSVDDYDLMDYAPSIVGGIVGGALGKRVMRNSIKSDTRKAGYARAQSRMAKQAGNSEIAKEQDWIVNHYQGQARGKSLKAFVYGAAPGAAAGHVAGQEYKKPRK